MIDALLNFTSLAAAKADPVLLAHMDQLQAWRGSYVLPDVKSWRVSQDVAGTDADGNPKVTHVYRTGWTLMISLPQVVPALFNHAALIVMIDRDRVIANQTGQILKANVTTPVMQDTRWEPVFAGVEYPWGNWK
jgi:hypothetical protein